MESYSVQLLSRKLKHCSSLQEKNCIKQHRPLTALLKVLLEQLAMLQVAFLLYLNNKAVKEEENSEK